MEEKNRLLQVLQTLKEEHKICENELKILIKDPVPDYLEIQRIKKKKLELKDQIKVLKNQLTPDIIA
jgi:hypothetical protein